MEYKLLASPSIKLFWKSEKVKSILTALLVVVLVSASFFYLFTKDNYQGKLTGTFLGNLPNQEETSEEENECCQILDYQEEAQEGEGLTHVARRVLENHFKKENITDFTVEHKVFMEDYLQRRLGGHSLVLGEKVTISQELISQAISEAELLSQDQLDNLKQYSGSLSP